MGASLAINSNTSGIS